MDPLSAEVAFKRMRARGEERDANFTPQFFETLRAGYLQAMETHCKRPVVLDWNHFGQDLNVDKFIISLTHAAG